MERKTNKQATEKGREEETTTPHNNQRQTPEEGQLILYLTAAAKQAGVQPDKVSLIFEVDMGYPDSKLAIDGVAAHRLPMREIAGIFIGKFMASMPGIAGIVAKKIGGCLAYYANFYGAPEGQLKVEMGIGGEGIWALASWPGDNRRRIAFEALAKYIKRPS